MAKHSIFERYPKASLTVLLAAGLLLGLVALEFIGAKLGLGKAIVYDTHPLYGYRPLPNQTLARRPGVVVKTNNLGLRANEDWDPSTTQHKILFLGDSVTYGGSYITNDDLFSHLATQNLPHYQSGNAGVNAWGVNNVHALITQTHFLPAQIYVSVFPEGDFYRGLMRVGGQPFWTKKPRYALEELFQYIVYKIHLKKIPPQALSQEEKIQVVQDAVVKLKEYDGYLKAKGRQHLIYITPSRSQVLGFAPFDPIVKLLLSEQGLTPTYLHGAISKLEIQDKKVLFHDEIHLSKEGHAQWAKIIEQDLLKLTSA